MNECDRDLIKQSMLRLIDSVGLEFLGIVADVAHARANQQWQAGVCARSPAAWEAAASALDIVILGLRIDLEG